MSDGQKPVTTIRFPPALVADARKLASRDGKSFSAWVQHLIAQETGRRDGKCPTCGAAVNREDP